jgi:hypothetical protein
MPFSVMKKLINSCEGGTMTVRRTPLLLLVGSWAVLLLVGLLGSTTVPSVALADGSGGAPLPTEDDTLDTFGQSGGGDEPDPDKPSILDLFIDLILVLW